MPKLQTQDTPSDLIRLVDFTYLFEAEYPDSVRSLMPPPFNSENKFRICDIGRDITYTENGETNTYYGTDVLMIVPTLTLSSVKSSRVNVRFTFVNKLNSADIIVDTKALSVFLNARGLVRVSLRAFRLDDINKSTPVLTSTPFQKFGILDAPLVEQNMVNSDLTDDVLDSYKGRVRMWTDANQKSRDPTDKGLEMVDVLFTGYDRDAWPPII